MKQFKDYKLTHFCTADLLERGWTKSMIKKMLVHDVAVEFKQYGRTCLALWYLQENVVSLEDSHKFLELKEKSKIRILAGKKSAETKRQELISYIEALKIKIATYSLDKLEKLAIESYINFQIERGRDFNIVEFPAEMKDRLQVNFLRHHNQYEKELLHIFGKVGTNSAYVLLKNKILSAISKKYPHLKSECHRQML